MAPQSGKLDIVEWLIEKGVDVKATDNDGNTVLHRAAQSGKLDIVLGW
jgi:ankyrin repeat protein